MNRNTKLRLLPLGAIAAILGACASIGNPSGGPRDEEPPRFVRSTPAPGAVNFTGTEAHLYFDELVNVKDAFNNVIVSPPMAQTPRVSTSGRRITIKFPDSLAANTTYTVDFGSAIEDNNESNPLQGFTYTFSTGETLDTLGISGMVLSAFDLEPQQEMLVGVHSVLADSAFRKLRFDRVARTDDRGRFNITGLKPGRYRVYALKDADADMRYSTPEEAIGFYETPVEPYTRRETASDTIYNRLTGAVDSVIKRGRTVFLPNDVVIRSFTSPFKQQYIPKYERIDTTRLNIVFNSRALRPATYGIVGAPRLKDWAVEERSRTNDTVTLWIKPQSLLSADTLRVAVNFEKTDSLMRLVPASDTLRFVFDRAKYNRTLAQKLKEEEKNARHKYKESADSALQAMRGAPVPLEMTLRSPATQEVNRPIWIEAGTPLKSLDTLAFRMEIKKDTVWATAPPPRVSIPDSLHPRLIRVDYPWQYATDYRLTVDSLAAEGIYGNLSKTLTSEFKTRDEGDYSGLKINLQGIPAGVKAFVELLQNDKPIESRTVKDGSVTFSFLQPGKYGLRLYEDRNGNGEYDDGDFDKGLQPDLAYYYPKIINLKKNWSKEETWDVAGTLLDRQKPESLIKNKPKSDKRKEALRNKEKNKNGYDEEEEEDDPFGGNMFNQRNGYENSRKR